MYLLCDQLQEMYTEFLGISLIDNARSSYRVIIKEGHKVKRYYTVKICNLEVIIRFQQTKSTEHFII